MQAHWSVGSLKVMSAMCHVRIIPLLVHTLPQGPVAELPLRVARIEDHHASFHQAEDAVDVKRKWQPQSRRSGTTCMVSCKPPPPLPFHFSLRGMQNTEQHELCSAALCSGKCFMLVLLHKKHCSTHLPLLQESSAG